MNKIFANKVALVTGGSSGMGRATALAFAKEGANVVIAARGKEESLKVVEEIKALGSDAIFIRTDVSDLLDIKAMIAQTHQHFGRLDFAFNNAGIQEFPTALNEKTEALFDQIMNVNVKSVFFAMQYEIEAMLKQGGGIIVNNASVAGMHGVLSAPIYAASKHAVIGLTKSVALEFAKQNIRINAVCPGIIKTNMYDRFMSFMNGDEEMIDQVNGMIPIGRAGLPEEIASAVIWLCSAGASYMMGQTITIDGGFTAK